MHGGSDSAPTCRRFEWRRDTSGRRLKRCQEQAAVESGAARGLLGADEECGRLQNCPRRQQIRPACIRYHPRLSGGRTQNHTDCPGLRPKQTAREKSPVNQKRPYLREYREVSAREVALKKNQRAKVRRCATCRISIGN